MYSFRNFNTTIIFFSIKVVLDHIFPIIKVSCIMDNKMTNLVIWSLLWECEINIITKGPWWTNCTISDSDSLQNPILNLYVCYFLIASKLMDGLSGTRCKFRPKSILKVFVNYVTTKLCLQLNYVTILCRLGYRFK